MSTITLVGWMAKHKPLCLQRTCTGMMFHWWAPKPLFNVMSSNVVSIQIGGVDLEQLFLNKAIIGILKEQYFNSRKSLYYLCPQEFKQSIMTEDGGKGFEIPPQLVTLVTTFVGQQLIPTNSVANDFLDLLCPFCRWQVLLELEVQELWPDLWGPHHQTGEDRGR